MEGAIRVEVIRMDVEGVEQLLSGRKRAVLTKAQLEVGAIYKVIAPQVAEEIEVRVDRSLPIVPLELRPSSIEALGFDSVADLRKHLKTRWNFGVTDVLYYSPIHVMVSRSDEKFSYQYQVEQKKESRAEVFAHKLKNGLLPLKMNNEQMKEHGVRSVKYSYSNQGYYYVSHYDFDDGSVWKKG